MKNPFKTDRPPELESRHRAIVEAGKIEAKSLASKNLPKANETLLPYISGIKAQYKSLLSKQLAQIGNADDGIEEKAGALFAGKSKRLEKQLRDLNAKRDQLNVDRSSLSDNYQTTNNLPIHIALLILSITEASYTISAFSALDQNSNISRCFIFLGLVILFLGLPIIIVGFIRATENSPYKIVLRAMLACVLIGCLWVFGVLRISFLSNINDTSMDTVSMHGFTELKSYYFVAVNLLFLVVTVSLSSRLKTPEQKKINIKAKQFDNALIELNGQIAQVEADFDALPDKMMNRSVRTSDIKERREEMKERVQGMYTQAVSAWLTENRLYRSNEAPKCFDEEIPSLK